LLFKATFAIAFLLLGSENEGEAPSVPDGEITAEVPPVPSSPQPAGLPNGFEHEKSSERTSDMNEEEEEEETGASSNADIEDNIMEGEKEERRNYMQWNGSSSSAEVEAKIEGAANAQKDAHKELDEVCSRLKSLSTKVEDGEDACEGQYFGTASITSQ
jgi:hypothetical protein